MAKGAFTGPLEQVDECCWRIPKSFRAGMRVDGLIFASEKLLQHIRADQAPEQVANVATLPGIQVASLAMPDIHWGYGFCIGGVCATDPEEGGVISPGGVGYDINCLPGDSPVLHRHGYTRPIADLASEWIDAELACFELGLGERQSAGVCCWFTRRPDRPLLKVVTESGDELRATADHPFWTPAGMVPLGQLRPGDRVACYGFEGVSYEAPSGDVLVSEEDFAARWSALGRGANGLRPALDFLRRRGLMPLARNSPAVPTLCKVLGFVFGDGSIHFQAEAAKGITCFYGRADDLGAIRDDLIELGLRPSRVYRRERRHAIKTAYADYEFDRTEEWFKLTGSAFALLLACLGAPTGSKASQTYALPAWLERSPLWHRRLFLAALFGAELTTPATVTRHGTVFGAPTLSVNKRPAHVGGGRLLLEQISRWLSGFGVETQAILADEAQTNVDGERSVRWRLVLSPRPASLRNLWARVGYEYNRGRARRAALAVQYLKHKQRAVAKRARAAAAARELAAQGVRPAEIYARLADDEVNARFIERSLYGGRRTAPRVGKRFPTFAEFCAAAGPAARRDGMVWERVASIEAVQGFRGEVYDLTVTHDDHNFVAGGFVVSNCGVRLIRTNLFYREVEQHLRKLVEQLFRDVPTGVGRSGKYRFDKGELRRLMGEGSRFLLGRDLADPSDIANTEAEGRIPDAEPDRVSDHALTRGAEQCGTLGSGNHFLEVQVVDHVFDEEVARVFGLEKDQVCVMIHSGSRGLGYQVCDDALALFRGVPERHGISLPDRQLACAPVESREGEHYIGAMRAAANFGFCNRQLLTQQTREVFERIFGRPWQQLGMTMLYDVAHNIAKLEEHEVDGKKKKVWVHRKGATRAFPAGHPELPAKYRAIGQPVIIPGDMGRASWVLVGQPGSMARTFGTTCHGAGRALSRTAAVKEAGGRRIDKELEARGVIARSQSRRGLAEEQPNAYKNVDDVVEVVHQANLSAKVARMRPVGVIKG